MRCTVVFVSLSLAAIFPRLYPPPEALKLCGDRTGLVAYRQYVPFTSSIPVFSVDFKPTAVLSRSCSANWTVVTLRFELEAGRTIKIGGAKQPFLRTVQDREHSGYFRNNALHVLTCFRSREA